MDEAAKARMLAPLRVVCIDGAYWIYDGDVREEGPYRTSAQAAAVMESIEREMTVLVDRLSSPPSLTEHE